MRKSAAFQDHKEETNGSWLPEITKFLKQSLWSCPAADNLSFEATNFCFTWEGSGIEHIFVFQTSDRTLMKRNPAQHLER
jgi:hypothetical protein